MSEHHHPRHGGRDRHQPDGGCGEGGPRPRRGRRPFDYGALRLVVLDMIAEAPRHGYELMKAIEERMGGGYSPSPGVIYPTLAWLEDMGFAAAEAEGSRRSFRITPEGEAFLAANRDDLAALQANLGPRRRRSAAPEPVLRAVHDLKRALRTRFSQGMPEPEDIARIASAIDGATREVESIPMTETTEVVSSTATVTTPKAAGYLAQLCKHFAHKIPARYEGNEGEIAFGAGTCRLHAEEDRLTMTVTGATPEAVAQLEDVMARHLVRFAFREELTIEWRPA